MPSIARLILLVPLIGLAGCDEEEAPDTVEVVRPVKTAVVEERAHLHERFFVGIAQAAQQAKERGSPPR